MEINLKYVDFVQKRVKALDFDLAGIWAHNRLEVFLISTCIIGIVRPYLVYELEIGKHVCFFIIICNWINCSNAKHFVLKSAHLQQFINDFVVSGFSSKKSEHFISAIAHEKYPVSFCKMEIWLRGNKYTLYNIFFSKEKA